MRGQVESGLKMTSIMICLVSSKSLGITCQEPQFSLRSETSNLRVSWECLYCSARLPMCWVQASRSGSGSGKTGDGCTKYQEKGTNFQLRRHTMWMAMRYDRSPYLNIPNPWPSTAVSAKLSSECVQLLLTVHSAQVICGISLFDNRSIISALDKPISLGFQLQRMNSEPDIYISLARYVLLFYMATNLCLSLRAQRRPGFSIEHPVDIPRCQSMCRCSRRQP